MARRVWVRWSSLAVAALSVTGLAVSVVGGAASATSTPLSNPYPSAVLSQSPSLYYRMDESSGSTAADSSGNNRSGSYGSGDTFNVAGALANDADTAVALGGAVTYNGAAGGLPVGNSDRSVELWFKTSSTADQSLFNYGTATNGEAFGILLTGGTQVDIYGWNDDVTFVAGKNITDNQWHYLVVTYTSATNTETVYLDDASLGSQHPPTALNTVLGQGLIVGSEVGCSCNNYAGGVDEVALYPSVLTVSQIKSHFGASGNAVPNPDPYRSTVLAQNPSIYYRLDELSGSTAADLSGNYRSGTYGSGDTHDVAGALSNYSDTAVTLGGAITYSGNSGGLPLGASDRSVELWFKTSGTGNQSVFGYGSSSTGEAFGVQLIGGKQVYVYGWSDDANFFPAKNFADNQWHYLVATYAGATNTTTAYLDGASLGSRGLSAPLNTVLGQGLTLGGQVGCGCNTYSGSLDEVAIYPVALTSTQVKNHYEASGHLTFGAGPSPYPSAVAALRPSVYYRLDESSGSTALDSSGNNLSATYGSGDTYNVGGALSNDADPAVTLGGAITYNGNGGLPVGNSNRSIELWFKTSNTADQSVFSSGWAGGGQALGALLTGGGTQVYVYGYNDDVTFTASKNFADNQWHYLVVTYTGATNAEVVYLDDISLGTQSPPTALNTGSYQLIIGNEVGCSCRPYTGSVDEFAVYPTVLTPTQVNSHYQASGLPGRVVPDGAVPGADTRGGNTPSTLACACQAGDPVSPATGDFYEAVTDLTLPGGGIPLHFTRTYDAEAAQAEAAAGTAPPDMGYGWTSNLGMSLTYNSANQSATITEENGAELTYNQYASGTSPSWCASTTNFCSMAPRVDATLNHNTDGTWTFTRLVHGSTTYTFTAAGVLSAINDPLGNSLNASNYTPSPGQTPCPTGDNCTAWKSSASGRQLVLALDATGRLVEAFDANSSLSTIFSYTGAACSSWAPGKTADLCQATDPGGLQFSYTYDSSNSTASLSYDMLSFNPIGATTATQNTYDSSGRVTQQIDPSGALTTFAYSGDNSTVSGGNTTVTVYPQGTGTGKPQDTTTYQYSSNVLVGEIAAAGTNNAADTAYTPDPASLISTQTTDGNGNASSATLQSFNGAGGTPTSSGNVLTSTDALGNTTAHAYNSFNQAWCTVNPADYANGKRCPSSAPSSPPVPGVADPNLGVSLAFYNSSDQLTAATDALGNTTTYAYTGTGIGVPAGLAYCSVDPVDYQNSVTCPAYGATHVTGTTTSTFDAAGDRLTGTDAVGNTTTYVYNVAGHPGLVSSETDPDGTVTTFSYNGAGQVTSQVVTFAGYSATTLNAYDSNGRQYCNVTPYEAAQNVTCPSLPPSSPPTPSSDPYLGATITTYDANGRVVQTTNPLGGITYTAYDQASEAFCTVTPYEAAQGVTCPSTPPSTPPTPSSDPYLGATITTYDANGRVIQTTNPLGGITLTSYDPANNVVQTTVESNNATAAPNVVTNKSYDADNQLVSTTVDPGTSLAATTEDFYDPNGNVFCSASATSVASGSYQCPIWQPAWITTPPSPSSLYSTTPGSAQANSVTTAFFNAAGQQVQSTNPDVNTTVSVADGDGRTYCTADPTNVSAWLSGHPSGTYPYLCPTTPPSTPPTPGSNPGYVTTIFDAAGHKLSSTDQLGDTTSYTYTPAGQVLTTTDPRGKVTNNCYYYQNGTGQCANGAPNTGGAGGDLYSTTTPATSADPSGEVTTTTYYPGDLVDATTAPAGTATSSYDAGLDLTSLNYTGTATGYATPTNLSYTYNVDQSRHTMVDATGTTTYSYDAAGNVTSQGLVAATGTGLANTTVSYTYFTTGAPNTIAYPSYTGHTNPTVTYNYDATGAMASVTDWLANKVTFAHDQDGNPTGQANNVSTTNPNGTSSTSFSYDAADLNTQTASTLAQTCGGNETLTQSLSGTGGSRNPDGQLTQYQTSYTGSCSGQTGTQRNYSYDQAGRVTYQGSTTQGANPSNFAYDPAGDPTTISSHDSTNSFDTYTQAFDNAGENTGQTPIAGSNGAASTYAYDTLGDQTTTTTGTAVTTYAYDQNGRMTTATPPGGSATTYLYNGDGLQTSATTTGTTKQLTWNTTSQLPVVIGDGTNDYIYGPTNQPVEQIALSTSTPTYLTYTPTSNSWISTNQTGDQTGYWAYDAYGTPAFGTPQSPFGYSGQYTDTTTGLINDRARNYQPQTGAFTTRDPAYANTDTAYTYANSDPINLSDPNGLGWCPFGHVHGPHSACRGSSEAKKAAHDAETAANSFVPGFSQGLQNLGEAPANIREHGFLWEINQFNPAYQAITGYYDEIQAAKHGCSFWTSFQYGLNGALGVVGTIGLAGGISDAGGGLFSPLAPGAEDGPSFMDKVRGLTYDEQGGARPWSISQRLRAAGPGDEFGLPTQGRIRFVPEEGYNPLRPLPRGPNGGYIDRFGNEWVVGPSRTPGQPFEWDVQLSRTGQAQLGWLSPDDNMAHINVSPLGEVTH